MHVWVDDAYTYMLSTVPLSFYIKIKGQWPIILLCGLGAFMDLCPCSLHQWDKLSIVHILGGWSGYYYICFSSHCPLSHVAHGAFMKLSRTLYLQVLKKCGGM